MDEVGNDEAETKLERDRVGQKVLYRTLWQYLTETYSRDDD